MNTKAGAGPRSRAIDVLRVVGAAAVLLVVASPVFAEPHGGGSGGAHSPGGHFNAPHPGGSRGPGGAGFSAAPHYYGGGGGWRPQAHAGGAYGYRWHGGGGYGWHGSAGFVYRPAWGGGYWHGGYWPRAYYGWSYPLYLGVLPVLYATYWWGGVPYYYVNNVYYTWNAADNGYVATDPPPVSGGYSDDVNAAVAAGPDGGNAQDGVPPDVAPAAGIIAYPRNGQSDAQQAQDRFECHKWANAQTGFDPTSQSSSGASASVRSAYGRAMAACLDARGYTVR